MCTVEWWDADGDAEDEERGDEERAGTATAGHGHQASHTQVKDTLRLRFIVSRYGRVGIDVMWEM